MILQERYLEENQNGNQNLIIYADVPEEDNRTVSE